MDLKRFKHHMHLTVRNFEIDWQGVVHNAVYLHYFEIGRVEYLNAIGAKIDINTINSDTKIVLVRNEIDYRAPAYFGDIVTVHTRISAIKSTSFIFEGVLERKTTKEVIGENVAIHVWLNGRTNKSRRVPDDFRKLVQRYEGRDYLIEWKKIEV